jgi:hypothetical protein
LLHCGEDEKKAEYDCCMQRAEPVALPRWAIAEWNLSIWYFSPQLDTYTWYVKLMLDSA